MNQIKLIKNILFLKFSGLDMQPAMQRPEFLNFKIRKSMKIQFRIKIYHHKFYLILSYKDGSLL